MSLFVITRQELS